MFAGMYWPGLRIAISDWGFRSMPEGAAWKPGSSSPASCPGSSLWGVTPRASASFEYSLVKSSALKSAIARLSVTFWVSADSSCPGGAGAGIVSGGQPTSLRGPDRDRTSHLALIDRREDGMPFGLDGEQCAQGVGCEGDSEDHAARVGIIWPAVSVELFDVAFDASYEGFEVLERLGLDLDWDLERGRQRAVEQQVAVHRVGVEDGLLAQDLGGGVGRQDEAGQIHLEPPLPAPLDGPVVFELGIPPG